MSTTAWFSWHRGASMLGLIGPRDRSAQAAHPGAPLLHCKGAPREAYCAAVVRTPGPLALVPVTLHTLVSSSTMWRWWLYFSIRLWEGDVNRCPRQGLVNCEVLCSCLPAALLPEPCGAPRGPSPQRAAVLGGVWTGPSCRTWVADTGVSQVGQGSLGLLVFRGAKSGGHRPF